MTHFPPEKAKTIMKQCVDNIIDDFLKRINDACEEFPDVEENKNILVDSVISSVFCQLILLRVQELPANDARRYMRDVIISVKDYVNEDITKRLLDDLSQ